MGASAALTISGLPFLGPIGGCRVGYKDGEYVLNPLQHEVADSDLDLVMAGTRDGVLMVESEAKELSEDQMLGGILFAHQEMQAVIKGCQELKDKAGKEDWVVEKDEETPIFYSELKEKHSDAIGEAFKIVNKSERGEALGWRYSCIR